MENPVIIIGAGRLGEVVFDIFSSNQVIVYCFLDEDEKLHGTEIDEISILGDIFDDEYLKIIGKKCNACIAVEDISLKKSIVQELIEKRKTMPVNAIHAGANISERAKIGHGNIIEQGVIVGTKSDISNHIHIGAGSVIGNHVTIGDFTQVGGGSTVGAGVQIEEDVFIGSGTTIVSGIKIEKGARIGAGSVVISNVSKNETVFGNPAKKVE